jgi:hypothetical protein
MTQPPCRRRPPTFVTPLAAALAWLAAAAGPAGAHPLSQGALDVVVQPDRVDVRARVTFEEVAVTDMLTAAPGETEAAAAEGAGALDRAYARHAKYLAAHVHVLADGKPLAGSVARVVPPDTAGTTRPAGGSSIDTEHVVYELEYRPAAGQAMATPGRVELRQDVLVGVEFAPGVTWEASYVVRIGTASGAAEEGLLLTSTAPVLHNCDWDTPPGAVAAPGGSAGPGGNPPARVNAWRMVRDFAYQGVHHILVGYDHLLFIGALVLAARGLWDLVKVVSAFTLAHTITLALSALDVVRLPDWVVEPMIAGSIVFVAAQNVLWPKHTGGWMRLAAAFFFGLFHGLGYAGGLLDAMEGMSGRTILLAILAFSVGVELGHQVVVLPLFGALHLARRAAREPAARDRVSLAALRYGSAVICVAGLYYFVGAVGAGLALS